MTDFLKTLGAEQVCVCVCQLNPSGTDQLIHDAIVQVVTDSGVDARIIFAVVLQASACLSVVTTSSGGPSHAGLIESHNGVAYTDAASILQSDERPNPKQLLPTRDRRRCA